MVFIGGAGQSLTPIECQLPKVGLLTRVGYFVKHGIRLLLGYGSSGEKFNLFTIQNLVQSEPFHIWFIQTPKLNQPFHGLSITGEGWRENGRIPDFIDLCNIGYHIWNILLSFRKVLIA